MFNVNKISGDGKSFYRCLSEFLYGKSDYYNSLTKTISSFCKENINVISEFKNKVEIENGVFIDTKEYINNMNQSNYWGNDIDITICSYLFGINVAIYMYSQEKNILSYVYSYIFDEEISYNPLMILIIDNSNHFSLLFHKPEPKVNNNQGKNIGKNYINDDNINGNKEDNKDSNKDNSNNSDNNIEDIPTIPIENILGSNENPFPKYTTGRDENLYLNIFKFLYNGIKNGKRTWPDYIEIIQDKKLRDHKKLDFYKKVGIVKATKASLLWLQKIKEKRKIYTDENGENQLEENTTKSELIQDRYSIENNRLYVNRYDYNTESEKKYRVPFANEINDILNEFHDKKEHQGSNETIKSIKDNKYFWVSLKDDVNNHIKKCEICNKK